MFVLFLSALPDIGIALTRGGRGLMRGTVFLYVQIYEISKLEIVLNTTSAVHSIETNP